MGGGRNLNGQASPFYGPGRRPQCYGGSQIRGADFGFLRSIPTFGTYVEKRGRESRSHAKPLDSRLRGKDVEEPTLPQVPEVLQVFLKNRQNFELTSNSSRFTLILSQKKCS